MFESRRIGENVCDIVCLMGPEARRLLPKLLDALAPCRLVGPAMGRSRCHRPPRFRRCRDLAGAQGCSLAESGIAPLPPGVRADWRASSRLLLDMLAPEIDEKMQE